MIKTPVVMISYNRPDLVRLTMRNVALAEGANERDITMFIDGPRNDGDVSKQEEIFKIVSSYQAQLPRLKIIRRNRNYGCRGNIVDAITSVISHAGRAIVIEDDILISRTFLRYMDAALDFYEKDKRIWCINAYQSPYLKIPKGYSHDVYLNPVNMCWGWGTWRDRWSGVDFDLLDWQQKKNDVQLCNRLNKAGRGIIPMLDSQFAGRLKTWDVQCTYYVVKNDLRCVEPVYPQSKNIGFVPSGEHITQDIPFFSRQRYYNYLPRLCETIPDDPRIYDQWEFIGTPRNFFDRVIRKIRREVARFKSKSLEPIDIRSRAG